jgi:hypothetical protein
MAVHLLLVELAKMYCLSIDVNLKNIAQGWKSVRLSVSNGPRICNPLSTPNRLGSTHDQVMRICPALSAGTASNRT